MACRQHRSQAIVKLLFGFSWMKGFFHCEKAIRAAIVLNLFFLADARPQTTSVRSVRAKKLVNKLIRNASRHTISLICFYCCMICAISGTTLNFWFNNGPLPRPSACMECASFFELPPLDNLSPTSYHQWCCKTRWWSASSSCSILARSHDRHQGNCWLEVFALFFILSRTQLQRAFIQFQCASSISIFLHSDKMVRIKTVTRVSLLAPA